MSELLHNKFYLVDCHCDTLSLAWKLNCDLDELPFPAQSDLNRLLAAGVDLVFFAAFVERKTNFPGLHQHLQQIEYFHQQLEKFSRSIQLIRSFSDIEQIKKKGRLAALLAVEGGEVLEEDLSMLHLLFRLGVRCLGLTWNQRNALADGIGERLTGGGLTLFGRSVVREMNSLGMVVDVSHLSEVGFWDVLQYSEKPVIASHANCRSIHDHPRNLTDAQLKGLAQKEGILGITLVNDFLSEKNPGIDTVLDHIEHAVEIMGVQHVSLGTDFDGVDKPVLGLEDVTRLPVLTKAMQQRGFTEKMIKQILGENCLELLGKVMK